MVYLFITASLLCFCIGLIVGKFWRPKTLGKLVIQKMSKPPYTCGCLLLIEKEDDLRSLKQGDSVELLVSIKNIEN